MNIKEINNFLTFKDYEVDKLSPNKKGTDFKDYFKEALNTVNNLQIESDYQKELLAIGEVDNLHDVSIAAEKANVALQVAMSIRGKIVEAYKEIMRIQI